MKLSMVFLVFVSLQLRAEEPRKVQLRQVDVRQRLGLSVNPVIGGRIRMRLSVEQRYKAKAVPSKQVLNQ